MSSSAATSSSSSSSSSSSGSSVAFLVDDFTTAKGWYKSDGATGGSCGDAGTPAADPLTINIVNVSGSQGGAKGLYATSGGAAIAGYGVVGLDLSKVADGGTSFDASQYTGVTFWAAGTTSISPSIYSTGSGDAGTANVEFRSTGIQLTTTWTQYRVPFSTFNEPSWVTPHGIIFDPAVLTKLQFAFNSCAVPEFTIQDVGFY